MKVFVAGSGTMGAGIAQVFAQSGYDTILYDISIEIANAGIVQLNKSLMRQVERGKMEAAQKDAILAKIAPSSSLDDAAPCDLVVEAIIENMDIKKEFFSKLDKICKLDTIFATNTSSLSITEIAAALSRQDRFLGMHFFNPAPVMKLVEVIKGFGTSEDSFNKIFALSKELGKEPVEVKEAPGFVVNKILVPMINEAICVLDEGTASAVDIDTAMRLGAGHPMGPLALADLIGIDVVLNVMNVLYDETGDPKYRPSYLLKKMVRAGRLGKKTGKGFHVYEQ